MSRQKRLIAALLSVISMTAYSADAAIYYGKALCAYPQYECIKVASGQTWENLFPDEKQRDIVQRINRTYNNLWPGKEIAVPKVLKDADMLDFAPFAKKIEGDKEKQIIVDQEKLAWGAYDEDGQLVRWGPISSGSNKCSDNSSPSCLTQAGIFRIFSKENEKCKSNIFPVGKGGARMPYCMYFHKGLALHGSSDLPGYRASHGCIRIFTQDAIWLNHEFVELSSERNNFLGTKVVVRPLTAAGDKS